jgi:hypothetical protein
MKQNKTSVGPVRFVKVILLTRGTVMRLNPKIKIYKNVILHLLYDVLELMARASRSFETKVLRKVF